jgi:hypothetical protein
MKRQVADQRLLPLGRQQSTDKMYQRHPVLSATVSRQHP